MRSPADPGGSRLWRLVVLSLHNSIGCGSYGASSGDGVQGMFTSIWRNRVSRGCLNPGNEVEGCHIECSDSNNKINFRSPQ
jgi:hypothetical protein